MSAQLLSWVSALPWMLGLALLAWIIATSARNVGLVDIAWPLFLLQAAICYALLATGSPTPRGWLALVICALWAVRLAAHLAQRNWNAPEDHRYQAIRKRNEPGFWWKSLYLVFFLQAGLALIVAASLNASIAAPVSVLGWLDVVGAALALGGLVFEGIADWQLQRFLAHHGGGGKVMDQGLWRYTRHPNYFGEFCVWWGLFLVALAAGGWWSFVSPLLMSVLLLRVSGVTLLEKDIGHRRPGYVAYAARTNAFFPGPPRTSP